MRAIGIDELAPGMILARSIINDDMIVILSEGTSLTKAHISRLGFLDIETVYIKDEYELNENYLNVDALFNPASAFVTEYKEVLASARAIFDDVGKGGAEPIHKSRLLIHESLEPLSRKSSTVDYLLEVNHLASDVYNHSVRVAILAGVLAKWLRLPRAEAEEIILAGFLHDIGKTKFPEKLLSLRVDTLTGADLDAYMQHTIDGQAILNASPNLSDAVKLTAMQHHEYMDGTGFPFNLSGADIHKYARIIAVVDLYDNITTEREGAKKSTPFEAIDRITKEMYARLDPTICVPFLNHIKEAFIGSRILLSNGLTGNIVRYSTDFFSQPLVRITQDDIVDLNSYPDLHILEYNPK